jgi:hypothetical protein
MALDRAVVADSYGTGLRGPAMYGAPCSVLV